MLLGLGLCDLSMTPSAIPLIKRIIRGINAQTAQHIAAQALTFTTPAEVTQYLHQEMAKHWAHTSVAGVPGN